MKVKLLFHDIAPLKVYSYDEKTKVVTVKICGTSYKFHSREYEVVENDKV